VTGAVITLARCPAGEGRAVLLVGDEAEAARLRASGATAIGPGLITALAAVNTVFPGARVVALVRHEQRDSES
jgi:hypothetical protein